MNHIKMGDFIRGALPTYRVYADPGPEIHTIAGQTITLRCSRGKWRATFWNPISRSHWSYECQSKDRLLQKIRDDIANGWPIASGRGRAQKGLPKGTP